MDANVTEAFTQILQKMSDETSGMRTDLHQFSKEVTESVQRVREAVIRLEEQNYSGRIESLRTDLAALRTSTDSELHRLRNKLMETRDECLRETQRVKDDYTTRFNEMNTKFQVSLVKQAVLWSCLSGGLAILVNFGVLLLLRYLTGGTGHP